MCMPLRCLPNRPWCVERQRLAHWQLRQVLLRDTCSPQADEWFPQFRSFDFYNGHSWAHGIFPSGDGKDNESSSEMYHFARAVKLFGSVSGDHSLEKRGELMLAIMRRSVNMYMLYADDNKVQPSNFIGNKVSGILFENKIDYSTYLEEALLAMSGSTVSTCCPSPRSRRTSAVLSLSKKSGTRSWRRGLSRFRMAGRVYSCSTRRCLTEVGMELVREG
ncbi:hypothetical protein Cantr_06851 [Candida viswanathii]|uniref:glucan endo-1,3-beta-D-glucosidase n=1 Tax=Candida viswanathii TaxID=5486 RepID=A0A367XUN5_9ASCO|nr:hypothetical protein Cantr_06851 [Candida viswanathii]